MFLYNVSFWLDNTDKVLVPRVPDSVSDKEDKTTKRVCLSTTVAGCMQAIAVGNRNISVGEKFILREFSIPENDKLLISSEYLYKTGRVPDALENNEYWYLGELSCEPWICQIISMENEFELAWTCISPKDCLGVIEKYIPNIQEEVVGIQNLSSKEMYNKFSEYVTKTKLYDAFDNVWDDLAEIEYAQAVKLTSLGFERISRV